MILPKMKRKSINEKTIAYNPRKKPKNTNVVSNTMSHKARNHALFLF